VTLNIKNKYLSLQILMGANQIVGEHDSFMRLKPLLDIYLTRPINGTAMNFLYSLPLVSTNG